jgi:dTDP-glucose 4,6-dehydratase
MRPDDGRAIPTFIRQALAGEPLSITGDGSQTRSVCYVDDTIRGILALAESDAPGPVNIGGPLELPVVELATTVLELIGLPGSLRHIERPIDDPQVRRPDITLARTLLGWYPQVPLRDGLARTISWFRRQLTTLNPDMSPPRTPQPRQNPDISPYRAPQARLNPGMETHRSTRRLEKRFSG